MVVLMKKLTFSVVLIILLLCVSTTAQAKPKTSISGDPGVVAQMHEINAQLAELGVNIRLGEIEFYTIGRGRPVNRIHQNGFRWMANDEWREAQGDDITYLVDQSDGATASGLSNVDTEGAIDNAMATWNDLHAMRKVNIIKRADYGVDPDIYDYFYGFGGYGMWWLADIVHAGWYPQAFFEAVGGPGGGEHILAFSVTFYWVDDDTGEPIDKNGDNYIDTALNEVYFNDFFNWGIDWEFFDVETVALHESGHSLCLGHFGPPPVALMNPVYSGIIHSPYATDVAGINAVWDSWPK